MSEQDSMKLFGSERPSAPAGDPVPAVTPAEKPPFFSSKWSRRIVSASALLLVLVGCAEVYRRANHYGTRVVEAHPVDARVEIINPPAWLDRRIISALLDESYKFAQKDETTYNRARNTLDAGILRDFADLYTGYDYIGGQRLSRQANGYNAWIKSVKEVRRAVARDKSIQTIQIVAEWRQPAAWVRSGTSLYLIDADGTRLPGDYSLDDRPRSRLLVLSGIDLPATGIPRPGESWAGNQIRLGDDMLAGMNLINLLDRQSFASQIDAIDLTNFNGRKDPRATWIVLNTVWPTAAGTARQVNWGRPVGEEKYYEVQATAKVKTLNELFERYGRIDAGRDYVDIRTEVVRLPKLALVQ